MSTTGLSLDLSGSVRWCLTLSVKLFNSHASEVTKLIHYSSLAWSR